jgi:hypothetical protein
MNNYLTRLVVQILVNNEDARDDWMLTIREVHERELSIWYMDKSEYFDAFFSGKLSNVQTIGRIWRLAQEKRPELRGKNWEERQKQSGLLAAEFAEEQLIQASLF